MSSSSLHLRFSHLGFRKPPKQYFPAQSRIKTPFCCSLIHRDFSNGIQFCGSQWKCHRNLIRRNMIITGSMGEDSVDSFSFNDWEDSDGVSGDSSYILSSSGEDSDTEYLLNPVIERDFSGTHDNFNSSDGALSMTHHLSMLRRRRKTNRIRLGALINMGLIAFLVALLLFVDWCSWRIVRLPLPPFYLTRPFLISAALASCLGYVCIPIFDRLRIHQIFRKEGPVAHHRKKGTPTMGGLFFIPVGITVGIALSSPSSAAVFGAAVATIAFAAIGLLDDLFCSIKNDNYGLPAWIKVLLEVAVGIWFSFWLNTTNISSPYSMKMLVPLPAPLGLVYLGKLYLFLTTFCFVSMGNGINLTDGLDGLAGGTAALAFIGMSIAVLPISSDLAIFGASMAGACIGFLVHNRYRASIFMGDTGSLALGGALAAMAACTGMFFPLFISSGIFVLEALSVIMQVLYFKSTRCWFGAGQRLFRMAPLHHHLELCGFREPLIVGSTYIISYILSIFAGIAGVVSLTALISWKSLTSDDLGVVGLEIDFLRVRPLGVAGALLSFIQYLRVLQTKLITLG